MNDFHLYQQQIRMDKARVYRSALCATARPERAERIVQRAALRLIDNYAEYRHYTSTHLERLFDYWIAYYCLPENLPA